MSLDWKTDGTVPKGLVCQALHSLSHRVFLKRHKTWLSAFMTTFI